MLIYFKNFILCGEIDYHCLLCQESFQNTISVDKHLRWDKHRAQIKYQEYANKNECIYKVRDSYYCEICNELTENAGKHKALPSHINKKKNPEAIGKNCINIIRNPDDTFTIENKFQLNLLQWHGIKNDYCTLCKRSVRNLTIHINLNVHIINLISCETKTFQEYYYRKICDGRLYCFLCCEVFSSSCLETHWSLECDITIKSKLNLNATDRELIKNDPELAKALFEIQKLFFNIDTEHNQAECLQCKNAVEATLEAMLKHRYKHTSNEKAESESTVESYEVKFTEVVDHGKRRHELAVYGKENYIRLNQGGSWGYCSICDVSVSAHMKQLIDHVQGLRHRSFLELIGIKKPKHHEEPPCSKQKFTSFLSHVYRIEHKRMYYVKDYLPLTDFCFMLMKEVGKKAKALKCFACDIIVDRTVATEHYRTKTHKDKILACYVMKVNEGMEFLRLIRPNLYHCGVCNVALPYWESVRSHLMTIPHTFNKSQKVMQCNEARELRQRFDHRNKKEYLTIQLKRLGLH